MGLGVVGDGKKNIEVDRGDIDLHSKGFKLLLLGKFEDTGRIETPSVVSSH